MSAYLAPALTALAGRAAAWEWGRQFLAQASRGALDSACRQLLCLQKGEWVGGMAWPGWQLLTWGLPCFLPTSTFLTREVAEGAVCGGCDFLQQGQSLQLRLNSLQVAWHCSWAREEPRESESDRGRTAARASPVRAWPEPYRSLRGHTYRAGGTGMPSGQAARIGNSNPGLCFCAHSGQNPLSFATSVSTPGA